MWFFMAWRLFLAWPRPPAVTPTDPCPFEWPDWPKDPSISRISLFIFAIRSLEQRERVRKGSASSVSSSSSLPFPVRYSQGDDIGVGVVHSDGYGVLVVLVPGIVIGCALQEETHQPAVTERRKRKLTDDALHQLYESILSCLRYMLSNINQCFWSITVLTWTVKFHFLFLSFLEFCGSMFWFSSVLTLTYHKSEFAWLCICLKGNTVVSILTLKQKKADRLSASTLHVLTCPFWWLYPDHKNGMLWELWIGCRDVCQCIFVFLCGPVLNWQLNLT